MKLRIVSELCQKRPETPVKHRDLRGYSDAHHCCRKSLIGSALVGFRYASACVSGIDFQACSFIRLRSRLSSARATARCLAVAAPPRRRTTTRTSLRTLESTVYGLVAEPETSNCVRPPNVLRSLTAIRPRLATEVRRDTIVRLRPSSIERTGRPRFGPSPLERLANGHSWISSPLNFLNSCARITGVNLRRRRLVYSLWQSTRGRHERPDRPDSGHPRLLTMRTIALEPRLSAGVDLVLGRT